MKLHATKWGLAGLCLVYYVSLVGLELVLRVSTLGIFGGLGLFYLVVFSVPMALALGLLGSLAPPRFGRVVNAALLGVVGLLYVSQLVYYKIFKTFYVVYSMLHGGKAASFWHTVLNTILDNLLPFLLFWVPMAGMLLLGKRLFSYRRPNPKIAGICLAAVLCVQTAGVALLWVGGKEPLSPYDAYFNTQYMDISVNKLGYATAFRLDLKRLLFGFTPRDAKQVAPPADQLAQTSYPPNVLPLDWDALIAAEPDARIDELHRYFASVSPTYQNEMTGLFRGNNLILITAESFSPYAVDEVLTPTLYRLLHEGMRFSNFYTPLWGVSTLDGEYTATQGLLPKSGVWSMQLSAEHHLPFTLGNQFRALGYTTKAYHNHDFDYYGRDRSHPNMGYDYKGLGSGLNITPTWPESDWEMMDVSTADYLDQEPFHAYYMTVSGHLEYNWNGNDMAAKHRTSTENLPHTEAANAYLACNIELDRALELLLARLNEAGIAERTVIALSADHYPYGLSAEDLASLAGHPLESNFELYRNELMVYRQGMEPLTVDKPMSSLDILPTLSNLFGLPYDSRLLMGRDVFSQTPPLVIFANRSWLTDRARYNALTGEVQMLDGSEPDQAEVRAIQAEVSEKFLYSAKLLEDDYFAFLG